MSERGKFQTIRTFLAPLRDICDWLLRRIRYVTRTSGAVGSALLLGAFESKHDIVKLNAEVRGDCLVLYVRRLDSVAREARAEVCVEGTPSALEDQQINGRGRRGKAAVDAEKIDAY